MIVVICGPPAVGKTTVAILLRERLAERGHEFGLLDSDRFKRNTYDRLYDRVADSEGHWIVAGTFYKRQWQERFQALDDLLTVYLRADLETCLERNRARDEPIDEAAVHIVYREFDEPDADLTVDVTACSAEAVVGRILDVLENRL